MITYKSKVSKATSNSDTSTRVIIPQGIRRLLEINPGDSIEWIVTFNDSEVNVQIKKSKEWKNR